MMISAIVYNLLKILIKLPIKEFDKFNECLISMNEKIIKSGYSEIKKYMSFKFSIIYALFSILFIFTIFYIMIFCSIYESACISWLLGCMISLIFFFLIVQVVFPLFLTCTRTILRKDKFKDSKTLKVIYQGSYYIL